MIRFIALAGLLLLVGGTREAAAQRRVAGHAAQPALSDSTELSVRAQIGSKSYSARLTGSCKHEPSASIYDIPAALYTVEASGGEGSEIKQLNLTLWRPKNGSADQVSLSLQSGSRSTRIDVNPRSKAVGTATVELKPAESGGTFELKGKDAKGTPLQLTIGCAEFAGIEAEGG
jgi:hypothetical protein